MAYKESIIWLDKQMGIVEFLLPFILVFTILYAIMIKAEILGKNKDNLHLALAFAMSLLVTAPAAYYGRSSISNFLQIFLPWVILLMAVFFMWAVLVGALGMEVDSKLAMTIIGFLLFLELIIPESLIIFFIAGVQSGLLPASFFSKEIIITLLMFFFLFLVIWFISRDSDEKKEE